MSTWATFRTTVEAALAQALPTALRAKVPASWSGGPRQFGDNDGRLLLDVVSHVEEHVREAEDADDGLLASANLIVLQVMAESQHDDPTYNALRLIEQVRLGLRKESVYAILDAAGVSVLGEEISTRNVSYSATGRKVSAYLFELSLRTTFTLEPEADDEVGRIEHASYSVSLALGADTLTASDTIDDATPEP